LEVDKNVANNPNLVTNSPTSDGWLLKIKLDNTKELDDLLDENAYKQLCTRIENTPGNTGFDEYL
jgi:glycine cleavage system H protein